MKIGILGFAKVGKTTLFNILTRARIGTGKFSSGKTEAHVGIAQAPDPRLDALSAMFKPRKTTPATFEYVDIPGIGKEEGAESVNLAALRNADALAHVVRAFEDPEIPHGEGAIDPQRDIATIDLTLMLADLSVVQNRLPRLEKDLKKTRTEALETEFRLLERTAEALEAERPLRSLEFSAEERRLLRGYGFLTAKPLLVAINLDERDLAGAAGFMHRYHLESVAAQPAVGITQICAKIEAEIAELDSADADAFMKDLGIAESSVARVNRAAFDLLGLITFFTVGEDEVRGWTISRGTSAQRAAGTIHSDIERGFIRAEVVPYAELMRQGSLAACKTAGTLRLEGKEYVVADGDIAHFRFNV